MKAPQKKGFTLIELLVVITIIAILASIAVPVYNNITVRAEQSKALSNAKQIALGCKIWAIDFKGIYPDVANVSAHVGQTQDGALASDLSTSNFSALIGGGYTPSEEIYFISKEYNGTTRLTQPDGDLTGSNLDVSENAWAYVRGLTDSSNPQMPLVVTRNGAGATPGTTWPTKGMTSTEGGIWNGSVVLVRSDYAGQVIKVDNTGAVNDDNGTDMFTDTMIYDWGSTSISLVGP